MTNLILKNSCVGEKIASKLPITHRLHSVQNWEALLNRVVLRMLLEAEKLEAAIQSIRDLLQGYLEPQGQS